MKAIPLKKEDYIKKCMLILGKTFLPENAVYQRVEKALPKLNNTELDSLYSLLLSIK
jgi:hypothetical protein